MEKLVCSGCGARLQPESDRCDLCGTPAGRVEVESTGGSEKPVDSDRTAQQTEFGSIDERLADVSYCPNCGKRTRPDANFCSSCGSRLAPEVHYEPYAQGERDSNKQMGQTETQPGVADSSVVGKRVLIMLASAVAAVVVLYVISANSSHSSPDDQRETVSVQDRRELDPGTESAANRLRTLIEDEESDQSRLAYQRELVSVLIGGVVFDEAALVQEDIAITTDSLADWELLGNLYFDHMERVLELEEKSAAALASIEAYSRVLEKDPNNNDVRTDRAVAYLNSSDTPMKAIEEIGIVLENDPTHPQANFNRAVMLTMIGRPDEALEQYKRVVEITGHETPIHAEASRRIVQLEQQSGGMMPQFP